VVEGGRLVAVEPNPAHPTGAALCAKGRAAPEIVHSPDRLTRPLRRTRPKGADDPGWEPVSWDEALDMAADGMRSIAAAHGPEAVAFAVTTPSGTAMSDHIAWVRRLINGFGSPNFVYSTEICNWHKDDATAYTFGWGIGTPDLERAGCVLLWGHNPSTAWLAKAEKVAAAKARGARLVVVDPRRAGFANKADQWLRVRPGTDGALALAIAAVMIDEGWYDRGFVERWTNGPFLVREDTGRFLSGSDLTAGAPSDSHALWDDAFGAPAVLPLGAAIAAAEPALFGTFTVATADGPVRCRPAFDLYAELARSFPPERAAAVTGVPAEQIGAAARLLHECGPVAYYAWTGVGQHTNATQTSRAIALLYALTGSYEAPGGNVTLEKPPVRDVSGGDLISAAQRAKALGLKERPLGPAKDGWITSADLYRAIEDAEPFAVKGLVAFGGNLMLSHPDAERARRALARLDLYVHTDLFMNPTARLADLVLPVTSPWEHEGLGIGFGVDQEAEATIQLRPAAIPAIGEARPDTWIAFELARRLGLDNLFFGGSLEAGLEHQLAPLGLRPRELRGRPVGMRLPLQTRYRKYEGGGFPTPSRRVEIYSERFLEAGQAPLPVYQEPMTSPVSRPDLAERFPLVLTSAKTPLYCHSQHRGIAALRRRAPDPVAEMHHQAAAARGIAEGDWVALVTPRGRIRARARLTDTLDPGVVAAQHGWWQGCAELGLPETPVSGPGSVNFNALVGHDEADPISGSLPLRSTLCEVVRDG
jgi:anaerobic selenocysteine-containing dehydrogenase